MQGSFAQLTPPGEGGIAVFALEGDGVRRLLTRAVEGPRVATLSPGELAYGRLLAEDGSVLDEVIVACLQPRGRLERFELNCHAGGAAAAACAARLENLGLAPCATRPEPGLSPLELDFRAGLERVRTRRQLSALAAARAALPSELAGARELLGKPGGVGEAGGILEAILEESRRLGALLAVHRVVLAGPANAGKSTLFNRLVGADRAITSPHPGTTRDAVEAATSLRGLALELVDTAGPGAMPPGEIAARCARISAAEASGAAIVLLVVDGSRPMDEDERREAARLLRAAPRTLLVINKSDLGAAAGPLGEPAASATVSARTGEGLETLEELLARELLPEPPVGKAAACAPKVLTSLQRAYTCATQASVHNDLAAAREAAGILGSLREASA